VKQKETLIRATVRLPESLWKQVQHKAIDEHVSLQELFRRALAEYVSKSKGGR
jgi:predicted HicB family RNase H-like nuclease